MSAQKWWEIKGARSASAEQAQQEPPLFLYLVWADYGRLAKRNRRGAGTTQLRMSGSDLRERAKRSVQFSGK